MKLYDLPVGSYFAFSGFHKDICRIIESNRRVAKVLENNETSIYSNDREVIYPVQPYQIEKFIENNQKFILQSKL